jgi:hypothetical protein
MAVGLRRYRPEPLHELPTHGVGQPEDEIENVAQGGELLPIHGPSPFYCGATRCPGTAIRR